MIRTREAVNRQPHPGKPTQKTTPPGSTPSVSAAIYNDLFVNMVLSMSWQLALIVIIPIVGGYTLDQRIGSSPWLTLLGLIVAACGTGGVLWRTVHLANVRVESLQPKDDR